jgi:hypothetical protein
MMPPVGSIHIPNMHSVKMYSLGSAQRRNAKNMAEITIQSFLFILIDILQKKTGFMNLDS